MFCLQYDSWHCPNTYNIALSFPFPRIGLISFWFSSSCTFNKCHFFFFFLHSSSSAGGLANLCAISISSSPLRDTLFYLPRRLLEKCFALLLFTKKQKIIACGFDENNVKRIDTRSRRDYTRRSTLRACLALPERSFLLSPGLFSASSPPVRPLSLSVAFMCGCYPRKGIYWNERTDGLSIHHNLLSPTPISFCTGQSLSLVSAVKHRHWQSDRDHVSL